MKTTLKRNILGWSWISFAIAVLIAPVGRAADSKEGTQTEATRSSILFQGLSQQVEAVPNRVKLKALTDRLVSIRDKVTTQVRPSLHPTEAMIVEQVNELETFTREQPESEYTPGLRDSLASYYLSEGRFSKALSHWETNWTEWSTESSGYGRELADKAVAESSAILASLGRLEALEALADVNRARIFVSPAIAQLWNRSMEAVVHMRRKPGASYRCGVLAVEQMGRAMTGRSFGSIGGLPSPFGGFDMASLKRLGIEQGLPITVAFRRADDAEIVVPSVVHWAQEHYSAIVAQENGRYLVRDATFMGSRWMTAAAISEETSGYFLIPSTRIPLGWSTVNDAEARQIKGKGYPFFLVDEDDDSCTPEGGSGTGGGSSDCADGSPGMPFWKVREPNINLVIRDIPMVWESAVGPDFVLNLTWKQRNTGVSSSSWSHFSEGWESDLLSKAIAPYSFLYSANSAIVRLYWGKGSSYVLSFDQGDSNSKTNFFKGIWASRTYSGGFLSYLDVFFQNGSVERYQPAGSGGSLVLVSRKDATTKGLTFAYDQPSGGSIPNRLVTVTTADSAVFQFNYADSTDEYRITSVSGPNSRLVSFGYQLIGSTTVLSSITDAAGIISSFGYDSSTWWVNQMTTPYGTTYFSLFDAGLCGRSSNLGCDGVDRFAVVTEPDGTSKQVFVFYDNYPYYTPGDQMAGKIPTSFASSQIPQYPASQTVDPPVQTLSVARNYLNSHHWNRQQAASLSTTSPHNFNAQDFRISTTTHWLSLLLDETGGGLINRVTTPGWKLSPSQDGTTEGLPVFFDYAGKDTSAANFPNISGTNRHPSVIAQRMPDGTTKYQYIERNEHGMKTRVTDRWVHNGTIAFRTNTFSYVTGTGNPTLDGLLELEQRGPSNELLVGRGLHPTYTDQVKYETNSVGDVTTFDYNSDRAVTTKLTQAGLLTSFTYNSTSKRLEKNVDSVSGTPLRTNSYTWLNGYLRTDTDPRGLVRTFDYDFLGRLLKVTYPDSTTDQYFYELPATNGFNTSISALPILDRTAVKDRLNNYWYYFPNRNRQMEKIIEPPKSSGVAGTESTINYCGCGSPSSIVKASNTGAPETTSMLFNYWGLPTIVTLPDNTKYTNRYDLIGRLIGRDDSYMSLTNTYDNLGRLSSQVNKAGIVQAFGYTSRDFVAASTNANGVWRTNHFDNGGRLVASGAPDGGVERWVYSAGFPKAVRYTNQVGDVTTWAFDASQRQTNEIVVGIFTNSFSYNGADDLIGLYDGRQTGTTNRTQWRFDSYGRTTAKLYADGITNIIYAYDALNRLTNRWTKAKGSTKYAYDPVGNLTNVDYAVTADRRFVFDVHNRVSSDVVAGVITNTYAYIASGSLNYEETPQWNSSRVTLGYTSLLRTSLTLQQPTNGNWSQTYAYDNARRLTNIGVTAGNFAYSYVSAAGTTASQLVQGITVPTTSSGTIVTNLYDTTGRLKSTQLRNGSTVYNTHSYQINAANQRSRQTRTDGSYVDYVYDDAEQLSTALTYTTGGSPISSENFGYAYDASQNLIRRTNNVSTTTYPVNGLNQATGPDNLVYDPNGNRTSRNGYDVYSYDDENQLVTVTRGNSAKSEFVYDARGRLRIAREFTWSAGAASALIANGAITAVARNNFTGLVGTVIQVGASPVVVTELGRWKLSGNSGVHTVKIVRYADGTDVPGASVSVNLSGGSAGTFVYGSLASPVVLEANSYYHIVTAETNGGDTWYDWNQPITGSGGISSVSTVWSYGDGTFNTYGSASQSYGPVGLKGSTGSWNLASETRYIYDGMRIIQERNSSNVPQVTYTRGLDLSGSLEGAGGIGGLLTRTAHSGASGSTLTHAFYHSDGNGNVTYLINPDQTQAAGYVYDPFGRLISSTNSLPTANVMLFSSKLWFGNNVDLYYYGYRFYDPANQRWVNRDPIQEMGGVNIYRMSRNNLVNGIDLFGHCGPFAPVIAEGIKDTFLLGAICITAAYCALHPPYPNGSLVPTYPTWSDSVNVPPIRIESTANSGSTPPAVQPIPGVIDFPGSKPPWDGAPGTTVRGGTQSTAYGPDGHPVKQRDLGHPGHGGKNAGDHVHDIGRPAGGGRPTHDDRAKDGRDPQPDDPPAPRGPNVPPPCTK